MKSMLKSELARAAGVSDSTFSRWFQHMIPNIEQDLNITINRRCKLIPPNVAKWVCDKYCIDVT